MIKIYLDDTLIACDNHLPTEAEAMELMGYYVHGPIDPEVAIALSVGINVKVGGKHFEVYLDGDEKK